MRYELTVERQIQVMVEIEADSPDEALAKYEEGSVTEDEEIVDCTDISKPSIVELKGKNRSVKN